jgi:hypothetical protein
MIDWTPPTTATNAYGDYVVYVADYATGGDYTATLTVPNLQGRFVRVEPAILVTTAPKPLLETIRKRRTASERCAGSTPRAPRDPFKLPPAHSGPPRSAAVRKKRWRYSDSSSASAGALIAAIAELRTCRGACAPMLDRNGQFDELVNLAICDLASEL